MSIAYVSVSGTTINTGCTAQLTLADQSQANGIDEVVVADTLDNLAITGMPATGNSYIGRKCIVNWGPHTEERVIISDTAGTTTTRILGVNEPWATGKVPALNDTLDIAVEGTVDVENGTASGGITVNAQTKEYAYTNEFHIASGGFVQHTSQLKFEINDSTTVTDEFEVVSGGRWAVGYQQEGRTVNGTAAINENGIASASDGERAFTIADGAIVSIYDFNLINPTSNLKPVIVDGATNDKTKITIKKFTNRYISYNPVLSHGILEEWNVTGDGSANCNYEITANTEILDWVMVDCAGFDTITADTSTETLRIDEVLFVNTAPLVTARANKSWLVIDPAPSTWIVDAGTQNELSFPVNTSNKVDKGHSIRPTVKASTGPVQDAVIVVHENTQTDTVVMEENTDVDGYADGYFIHENYVYATATTLTKTTYGGHSLRVDAWLYFPVIQSQASDEPFLSDVPVTLDSNISQTTQATAITDGSGIVWNEDANPSELFDFTLGSGTALAGMILTFSPSGAVGTITEIASGDSIAGEIHLKTRNGTAIANGDTFSRTGGTVGTFSGTYTNDSKQPFSVWIEANAKSYQVQHDYWAARTAEVPLNAIGETAHGWGRDQQQRVVYKSGLDFSTERAYGKGIYIVNGGTGSVSHFTDDAGNTWVPPATVTLQTTASYLGSGVEGVKVRYEESDGTLIANGVTNSSGIYSYGIAAGLLPYNNAKVIVRDKRFEDPPDTVLNITTAGFALVIGLNPDNDINLP